MDDRGYEATMDSAAPLLGSGPGGGQRIDLQAAMVFLGRYELLRKLGEGGFGSVWLAKNLRGSGEVALKVLRQDLSNNPAARRKFDIEIRSAARLSHGRITPLLDAGVDGDTNMACFSMAVVEGAPLDRVEMSIVDKLVLFDQLMEALAYAHARGLVHRDLRGRPGWYASLYEP